MKKDTVLMYVIMSWIALMALATVVLLVMQPYFEARAFNKFTEGPKATYWDAVWTSLRVTAR